MSTTSAFIAFRVGGSWLAVDATQVQEILDLAPITPVPRAPPSIRGVMAFRGRVVAVLDLERFFGFAAGAAAIDGAPPPRILVVRAGGTRVGLVCDHVAGVVQVAEAGRRAVDAVQNERLREMASGEVDWDRGLLVLLDTSSLLESARVRQLRGDAQRAIST
jgi:purine-binding chemotaxis protein CheW